MRPRGTGLCPAARDAKCPPGIGKEAFGVEEESGGCHVHKSVGFHKGIGLAKQAAGAFCITGKRNRKSGNSSFSSFVPELDVGIGR